MCCDQMTVWRGRWITFAGIRFGRDWSKWSVDTPGCGEVVFRFSGFRHCGLSGRLTRWETRSHTARSNTNLCNRAVSTFRYVSLCRPSRYHVSKDGLVKKWKIDRIISVATLVTSLIALFLVLKKPAPVAQAQPAAAAVANAQSFQEKVQQLDQPKEAGQAPAEVRLSS